MVRAHGLMYYGDTLLIHLRLWMSEEKVLVLMSTLGKVAL